MLSVMLQQPIYDDRAASAPRDRAGAKPLSPLKGSNPPVSRASVALCKAAGRLHGANKLGIAPHRASGQ
jgi:hypothetical protein